MSNKTDILIGKSLNRLNRQGYAIDFQKKLQPLADRNLRTYARKFYEQKIPKPFAVKDQVEYQEKMAQMRRVRRLMNKMEEIEYFTYSKGKLLFKGEEIPEDQPLGKHHDLTTFNRKTFIARHFDDHIPQTAQLSFDDFNRRVKTDYDTRMETEEKEQPITRIQRRHNPIIDSRLTQTNIRRRHTTKQYREPETRPYRKSISKYQKAPSMKPQLNLQFLLQKFIVDILDEQRILQRMRQLAEPGSSNKYSLRIYRDNFKKMFIQRYGRDRITSFMALEYIEDFKSIVQTVKKIIALGQHQILYLTFITYDYDKDGLISNQDLAQLFSYTTNNHLLEKDLFRIVDYIKNNYGIHDRVSNPELFLTQLNFQTVRMAKAEETEDTKKPKKIINKLKKQTFTMVFREGEKQSEKNTVRKEVKKLEKELSAHHISINFETFTKVFQDERPFFFYDLLYVLSGTKYKHIGEYPRQEYVRKEINQANSTKLKEDPVVRYGKLLNRMRDSCTQMPNLMP